MNTTCKDCFTWNGRCKVKYISVPKLGKYGKYSASDMLDCQGKTSTFCDDKSEKLDNFEINGRDTIFSYFWATFSK